jgi:hypothetical protein
MTGCKFIMTGCVFSEMSINLQFPSRGDALIAIFTLKYQIKSPPGGNRQNEVAGGGGGEVAVKLCGRGWIYPPRC